jgi:hypothetical protein
MEKSVADDWFKIKPIAEVAPAIDGGARQRLTIRSANR